MAVTFAPDAQYVALDNGEWIYIVAKELAQQTVEKCKLGEPRVIAEFPGSKLEHTTFAHPFLERKILGVLGDYVTMDTGTGAVHTAPAHGADDFQTGVATALICAAMWMMPASCTTACRNMTGCRCSRRIRHRRTAQVARRAAGLREDRALVSALLALPQSHHLPRHRAVVYLHGEASLPAARCAAARWTKSRR